VSELDSTISLSNLERYAGARVSQSDRADWPMREPTWKRLFQILMIFERGAARIGD